LGRLDVRSGCCPTEARCRDNRDSGAISVGRAGLCQRAASDRSMTENRLPERRHLRRLERITVPGAPVFFITVCVHGRERVLARQAAADILVEAWGLTEPLHKWLVGRYVVMPDHVHFFASPLSDAQKDLSSFMRCWKRSTADRIRQQAIPGFRWQRQFFDHLLRSGESYAQKWEYVRQNPVRAKLAARCEDWPYQGEISILGA